MRIHTGTWFVSAAVLVFAVSTALHGSAPPVDGGATVTPDTSQFVPRMSLLGPPLPALHDPGGCRFLAVSPDSAFLASANRWGEVGVFALPTGRVLWTWQSPPLLLTSLGDLLWPFCPQARPAWRDGKWALIEVPQSPGWPGGGRAIFDPTGQTLAVVHNPSLSHTHVIRRGPDDLYLMDGIWLTGGYVHLFDRDDPDALLTIETERPRHLPLRGRVLGGLPSVTATDFSPTGAMVATGSSAGDLALWDTQSGACVARVRAERWDERPLAVRSLDFAPAGDLIVTTGDSGAVRLWTTPSLEHKGDLPGHSAAGRWVEFSPDQRQVASAGTDGMLCVWDLATADLAQAINWYEQVGREPRFAYSIAPNGILFGATRESGVVGLVNTDLGATTWDCPANVDRVSAFTVSPRRDLLAVGDDQGKIVVWPLRPSIVFAPARMTGPMRHSSPASVVEGG